MPETVFSVLPRIYDAATEMKNWSVALEEFALASGAISSTMYANNSHFFEYKIASSSNLMTTHANDLQYYLEQFADHDLHAINFMTASPPYKRVEDEDIWPGFQNMRDREDLAFLEKKLKIFRRVGYNLATTPGWGAFVALHFDHRVKSFEPNWIDNAGFLVKHMSKALEINRFCSQLQKQYNAVLTMLDRVDVGLCLCRSDGQVVVKNSRADRIFAERNGIEVTRENFLRLASDTQSAELREYVSMLGRTAQGKNDQREHVISARKRNLGEPYFLEVSPLRDGADELNDGFSGSFILIIDPANPPKLPLRQVATLYKLTPVEADVAEKLISGHTAVEIAEMRNVSIDTIKTQAKNIYSKIGANSRADLVRRIANISPPIK